MFFISGHYRAPIECAADTLAQAAANVERLREIAGRLDPDASDEAFFGVAERFYSALADDFNTPAAMAEIWSWVRDANRRLAAGETVGGLAELREALTVLGLETVFEASSEQADEAALALLDARQRARAEKDFAKADALRDELLELGWEIRDTAEGPVLRRA
jgi:cysteinyl-tRNA synthetase